MLHSAEAAFQACVFQAARGIFFLTLLIASCSCDAEDGWRAGQSLRRPTEEDRYPVSGRHNSLSGSAKRDWPSAVRRSSAANSESFVPISYEATLSSERQLLKRTMEHTYPPSKLPTDNLRVITRPPAAPALEAPTHQAFLGQEELKEPDTTSTHRSQLLTFTFRNAPLGDVLRRTSQESGLPLHLHSTPDGTFSFYSDTPITLSEAIDTLNDYLLPKGCILLRSSEALCFIDSKAEFPDGFVRLIQPEEVSTLGRNEVASVAIPVYEGLPAAVAQEIEDVLSPIGRAKPLTSSMRVLVTDTGNSLRRISRLSEPHPDLLAPRISYVYKLRNVTAEETALSISDFLSGRQGLSSSAGAGNTQSPSRPGTGMSQNGLVVTADKKTNCLLIRGIPSEVEEIKQLVCTLDQQPPQVVIQALLVEVELGDTDELGVELGIQDSVLFDRSVVDKLVSVTKTTTAANGVQTTNQEVISQTSIPGFNFNNQPLGNNTAIHPSRVGTQGLSSFGVGRVNGDLGFGGLVLSAGSDSVSVLLRALNQHYHVDILSRPQIRTVDNYEAMIQIGKQVPVVDGVSVTAVGSANPVIRQDQAGIILKVTPKISPDNQVLVDVKAEKSAYQLTPGTGVPIFTDAANGNVIEAPVKDITTAATTVNIESGETIVLGGMITRDMIALNRKVPFLGDIPYLGKLFQYRMNDTKRKELLIFLTPVIVRERADSETFKREEIHRTSLPLSEVQEIHGEVITPEDNVPATQPPHALQIRYPSRFNRQRLRTDR